MKITSLNMNSINPYNKQLKNITTSEAKSKKQTDKIEISATAKEMSVSSKYSSERAQKVQQLKQQVQSGEYQVNTQKVAEDILKYYRS